MSKVSALSESEILAGVILPEQGNLSRAVAESRLSWKFSENSIGRMNQLAELNQESTISAEDRTELDLYIRVENLLNLFHAKARASLNS